MRNSDRSTCACSNDAGTLGYVVGYAGQVSNAQELQPNQLCSAFAFLGSEKPSLKIETQLMTTTRQQPTNPLKNMIEINRVANTASEKPMWSQNLSRAPQIGAPLGFRGQHKYRETWGALPVIPRYSCFPRLGLLHCRHGLVYSHGKRVSFPSRLSCKPGRNRIHRMRPNRPIGEVYPAASRAVRQ